MNEYEKQAEDFLSACNATINVAYQYTGVYGLFGDSEQRDVYHCVITTPRGKYAHTFVGSIHNTRRRLFAQAALSGRSYTPVEARQLGFKVAGNAMPCVARKELVAALNKKPSAYDILAGLEKNDPGTFYEFCADYGYNDQPMTEYPRVLSVYQDCVEQYRALCRLFTPELLDNLREIN